VRAAGLKTEIARVHEASGMDKTGCAAECDVANRRRAE
jgi:hypothetical protein